MKRIWSVLVLAMAAAASVGQQAAETGPATGGKAAVDQEMLRRALTEGRRKLFSAGMNLNPKEYEAFWGIYADFEKEKEAIDQTRLAILKDVAARYRTMTGPEALGVVAQSAELQQKEIAVRKKYADAIGQKVSPAAGARFWQIDDYITTALRLDLLDNIPLFQENKPAS